MNVLRPKGQIILVYVPTEINVKNQNIKYHFIQPILFLGLMVLAVRKRQNRLQDKIAKSCAEFHKITIHDTNCNLFHLFRVISQLLKQ